MNDLNYKTFDGLLGAWNGAVSNRVKRVFTGVHLGNGHSGLDKLYRKEVGSGLYGVKPGEYVVFINSSKTALKLVTAHGAVLQHLKMPGNHQLDLRTISYLPKFFGGEEINYIGALKEVFKDSLKL